MKKHIIIGGVVIAALGALILGKLMSREQFAEGTMDPVVEVVTPETKDIKLLTGLVGTVEPEEVVYIYPKASGDVTEVYVKAGEYVEAGQQLCVIDTKQIESAKSTLDAAELSLRQARDDLSRQSVLYSGGGISAQAYQQAQDSVTNAQITYNNAKTNYDNQVSYSQITAPLSGTVETFDIEVFDTVSQSDLVCVISGHGARITSFSVTERIKNNLSEGDEITLEKDGNSYTGTIYEISTMADSGTGLFKIKARMAADIDESKFPTGSAVKLYVVSEQANEVLTVPLNSVYYDGGLAYVYTYAQETGTIHKIQVEAGLSDADSMEIVSGLSGTETVLVTWSSELYEGASVRLKDQGSMQPAE